MLKIIRINILTLILIGVSINNVLAANTDFGFKVTSIAENVYSIVSPSFGLPTPKNKGWNSNCHFVVTEKGVLLFDTGSSELIGNKIKKAIKSVTDQPVRWVINSHSHADHWFGNAAFSNSNVEIIASKQALATMKKHGKGSLEFYTKVTEGTIGATQLVYPTKLLSHGKKQNFGGVDVEFIFSNDGHSPGDVLMWLPKQKIILGGDVLSSEWMPVITGHGNIPNLINTLKTVVKLNPDIVLTGHGKVTTVESVKRDAKFLSTVWKRVKKDFKNDKKPNETLIAVKAKLESKYKVLYKDFNKEIERHVKLMYKFQG